MIGKHLQIVVDALSSAECISIIYAQAEEIMAEVTSLSYSLAALEAYCQ